MKNCEPQSINQLLTDMSNEASPPRKNGELDFLEPWESRAFGMAIALFEQKHYDSWDDFRLRLMKQIALWENTAENKSDWNYYEHWMGALEQLVVDNGILDEREISARASEFLKGERDEFY